MSLTTPVRFLIISDTHNFDLDAQTDTVQGFRRQALPKVDLVLHCGDLTENGGLEHHEKAIRMLSSIDAELKLVIAGNHDIDLDRAYYVSEGGEVADHDAAVKLWTNKETRSHGICYLDEGTHTFTLQSGVTFRVYASPYTPKYGSSAFQCNTNEDRYNTKSPEWARNVATPASTIPRGVDIVMTHGPPKYILDGTTDGANGGCEHLRRATCQVRPRLHCFGHVHPGWGAQKASWEDVKEVKVGYEDACLQTFGPEFAGKQSSRKRGYATVSTEGMLKGEQTLFINAAIMDGEQTNAPWLVDLEMPVESEGGGDHAGQKRKRDVEEVASAMSSCRRSDHERECDEP